MRCRENFDGVSCSASVSFKTKYLWPESILLYAVSVKYVTTTASNGEVFDIDPALLESLQHSLTKAITKASEKSTENNHLISQQIQKLALTKFTKVCEHLNIDSTDKYAFAVVVIVMSKTPDPIATARKFIDMTPDCILSIPENLWSLTHDETDATPQQPSDNLLIAKCDSAFNAMSEWLTLFEYVDLESIAPSQDMCKQRVHKHVCQVAADTEFTVHGTDIATLPALVTLYRLPRGTQFNLMLQRMLKRRQQDKAVSEINCLRFSAAVVDHDIPDSEQLDYLFHILAKLSMKPLFHKELENVLQQNAESPALTHEDGASLQQSRPRLQTIVMGIRNKQTSATQVYTQTIASWSNIVRFPVATSAHLQRVLYFICVQKAAVTQSVYSQFYNADVCRRGVETKPQIIDCGAIIAVIRSLRVYNNNVSNLLDFHSTCLQGLPKSKAKNISIVNVLQLYTAANQHDSIWKQCWQAVLPIMNHTIETSREAFVAKHSFEVDRIVECAFDCHIG